MGFTIIPSLELTALMFKNGLSKERNAGMNGRHRLYKSNEYFQKSNKHRDFLSLGEPIKVGHHSERGHRKMIDDAWNNMGKSVELSDKAAEHERVAKYWEKGLIR